MYVIVVLILIVFSVKVVLVLEILEVKGMICDVDCVGKKLCDIF